MTKPATLEIGDVVGWVSAMGTTCLADVVLYNEREGVFIRPRDCEGVISIWVRREEVVPVAKMVRAQKALAELFGRF